MTTIARSGGGRGYQTGFGNELESEALAGALPIGQNSPQRPPFGLVSELVSGTTFSAPRAHNRRTYLFRARPSVIHGRFAPIEHPTLLTPPLPLGPDPNQMRWDPWPLPDVPTDFLDGLTTICGNGSPQEQAGAAIHLFRANRAMDDRYFMNADGEMLFVPDHGRIRITTELGRMEIGPCELAIVPRGIKFQVDPIGDSARGFVCENFGLPFRLPDLGLIGSNGLANAADFHVPAAAYEVRETPGTLVEKFAGRLWQAPLAHVPFDVVAWRGNYLPASFDMRRFVAIGTATVDHPDPSVFCALTSPGDPVLGANADFLVLPPRWLVAEHSFRPPGFHRNCVAEFLAIVVGRHDSKAHGFSAGGASLHNSWAAHGPDAETYAMGRAAPADPRKIEDALVFMIETRRPMQLSRAAAEAPGLQRDYRESWQRVELSFPEA
ncbi:homogentisate 1,2-dioxygenase [Sphingomonas profundi]|uniref:homogentisate 1,2-dioxygenase n=1 Tax=Alterirhizorhabdus profundi TaxID=2681549 RepID=UPI0012E8D1AC|nr:homogentisate 1,2-dioxygenase [Sphingomonas profundi]